METVKLTFKCSAWTRGQAADLINRLYAVGAIKCEPSGEGNTYILIATFPAVCHYDGDEGVSNATDLRQSQSLSR